MGVEYTPEFFGNGAMVQQNVAKLIPQISRVKFDPVLTRCFMAKLRELGGGGGGGYYGNVTTPGIKENLNFCIRDTSSRGSRNNDVKFGVRLHEVILENNFLPHVLFLFLSVLLNLFKTGI